MCCVVFGSKRFFHVGNKSGGGESVTFDGEMLGKMLGALTLKGIECSTQDIARLYENMGRWRVLYSGCIVIVQSDDNIFYAVACEKNECTCMKFEMG